MNMIKRTFLFSLCALSMAGGAAYAQQSAPTDQWHAHQGEMMKQRMEQHWQHLHDALKITAAQESAWQAYRTASIPPAHATPAPQAGQPEHHDHMAMEKMSAPEHMEKMLDMMKKRQAMFETHLAAVKTFYAQLNADQQKTFNEHFMHDMHKMHHAHFGRAMHGGEWHHD